VTAFFGFWYVIALAMALFPPLYLYASGRSFLVLGMPVTIWYWLLNGLLVVLIVSGLYVVENIRGDLGPELPTSERDG